MNSENIQNSDILKLADLYFNEQYILYSHQLNAYNQFVDQIATQEIQDQQHIIYEEFKDKQLIRNGLEFDNVSIKPATNDNSNEEEILTPEYARINQLSYQIKLIADVRQYQEIVDYESAEKKTVKNIITEEKEVIIAKIPLMLRSKYCTTVLKKDTNDTECRFDPGCYFIIKGNEKVVISLEKKQENKPLVFRKKDIKFQDEYQYTCQITSINMNYDNINMNEQIMSIKLKKDNSITLNMTQFQEIPIFIFFRVLGIENDRDIINIIQYDENDNDMLPLLQISQNIVKSEYIYIGEQRQQKQIKTQEDAYQYLMNKMKNKRQYTETSYENRMYQKMQHLELILSRDFLPHMGITKEKNIDKAYYLGKMVNKLLNCYLGRIPVDDRDSFVNKRINLTGVLMLKLFRQYFKKMLNDCQKHFKKKIFSGVDAKPVNIIKMIKFTTIEQGFTNALSVGTWGKHKGVAQMLQRQTYKQFISHLRRIMPPSIDASTNKVTSMRHVNNVQYGYIDAVETPDGHNCGIHKHLSLMASITMNLDLTQIQIIRKQINDAYYMENNNKVKFLIQFTQIPKYLLKFYVNINLNGEWLGLTNKPIEFVQYMRQKRREGIIHRFSSVVLNTKLKQIDINTDGGRLIRPLLVVHNNQLILTKKMLNEISLIQQDKNKITKWNEFIQKYPNVIEYIDIEESEYSMIAMYNQDVINERQKMLEIIKNPNKNGDIVNRYERTYVKYTHCEFHPMMQLGVITSTIPFIQHNQSPRNYYGFVQMKQGLGLYCSNYRNRIDISYLLYNPFKPIVQTRASKYTNELDLPQGENIIVAIACYTGYNQEDSIILNKSSCQRGMFRSTTLKKHQAIITKNNITGQNDKFMKPNKDIVYGMKDCNYDKLNQQGFIPEETVVEYNDIMIGKCNYMVQSNQTQYTYKDDSEQFLYKSQVPGKVDKIYTDIINSDGYQTYNMRYRSERIPVIGDKLAAKHGQKGVCGLLLSQQDMPFTKDGIVPDIIINPCCFTGDTLISLSNGLSMRIDQFYEYNQNNMENVLSFDYKHNGTKKSYSLGMEYKGQKQTLKLTFMDGRQLTCTPDHQILVKKQNLYQWIQAQNLLLNEDEIVLNLDYTQDINYGDELLSNQINMNNRQQREKALGLARLMGLFNQNIIQLQHQIDVYNVLNDIQLVFGIKNHYVQYLNNYYQINFQKQIQNIQINNCPKSFIREYLASYFGYNCLMLQNDIQIQFNQQIQQLLQQLNIDFIVNNNKIIILSNQQFQQIIGFRYDIQKQIRLSLLSSYERYNNLNNIRNNQFEKYLSQINCKQLFNINKKKNIIPSWTMKLIKIEINGLQNVYDIGVQKFHNFVANGIIVHNCIPSRMTIAQIIECVFGKVGAIQGTLMDGTPFENVDVQGICDMLKQYGYDENGYEDMYCGMTGKKFLSKIFIGPTYYMRLKHMVQEKIHYRAQGHKQKLTRQPPEGRAKDGGLRFGEMERDAMISHGCAQFLKERLVDTSDIYPTYVCNKCGLFASKKKDSKDKDIWMCLQCDVNSSVSKIVIPYAFKLLIQELMAINILPRIKTDQSIN